MVDKTFIILQARMGSERLPSKVMKIIGGQPMIGILIKRLKSADIPIILATSTNMENDVLLDYANSINIQCYRGSETNVLERFYQAAKSINAQTIIRVTGDNPLLDGKLLRDNVNFYHNLNDDRAYLSTGLSKTFPVGISIEIFSFSLLEEAYKNAIHPGEFEHVTPYMYQNKSGDINVIKIARNEKRNCYRLTVDTPEDFLLHKKLIEVFKCDQLSLDEIIKILDENDDLHKLNYLSHQKKWDE